MEINELVTRFEAMNAERIKQYRELEGKVRELREELDRLTEVLRAHRHLPSGTVHDPR